MLNILTIIVSLSLVIWIYLLLFRGKFWLSNQRINEQLQPLTQYPSVCAVIPARNEADVLPISLKSLLNQDYPGNLSIILVDDQSDDNTGNVAQEIANNCQKSQQLQVISGQPLAEGWSGKLWAMKQGIEQANKLDNKPDYLLLTDADIEHHDSNLKELVKQAEIEKLAMTSLMVKLRCDSFWEQFLIPAFVFFFEKLYPFSWVNNPKNKMAAAAGGCILIRRQILEEIGGIEVVKQALIDDCSLAAAVKAKLQEDRQNIKQGINYSLFSRSYWFNNGINYSKYSYDYFGGDNLVIDEYFLSPYSETISMFSFVVINLTSDRSFIWFNDPRLCLETLAWQRRGLERSSLRQFINYSNFS